MREADLNRHATDWARAIANNTRSTLGRFQNAEDRAQLIAKMKQMAVSTIDMAAEDANTAATTASAKKEQTRNAKPKARRRRG